MNAFSLHWSVQVGFMGFAVRRYPITDPVTHEILDPVVVAWGAVIYPLGILTS